MQSLTPDEIRCLSKMQGCRIDNATYIKSWDGMVERIINDGYLQIGNCSQSLPYSDIGTVRWLLKKKGQKTGGKKIDLVQRVFQYYSDSEIEETEIPRCFVLTQTGEQVIKENHALLYYFNAFGATDILTSQQIIDAQNTYPTDSSFDILIRLFKERIEAESNLGMKSAITARLSTLYTLNHNDKLSHSAELEAERLKQLWLAGREEHARQLDSVLGIPLEKRRQLQQEANDELDDDWERELDAKNRAKAGFD